MINRPLSFYIRKKLNHKFTNNAFMKSKEFIEFLKKHDIIITEKTLENFEREGLLYPVYRFEHEYYYLHVNTLKQYFKGKLIIIPKKNDYKPWRYYKSRTKLNSSKKLSDYDTNIYYHPFQLFLILEILRYKKQSFLYYDTYTKENLNEIVENMSKNNEYNKKIFKQQIIKLTNKVGFFMLLEEPYGRSINLNPSEPNIENRYELFYIWKNTKYSANDFIKQCNLKIVDVKQLYHEICILAYFIDPLVDWYDLTRIVRPAMINKLKGKPATAQLYYDVARMLYYLYYDLTKEALPDPNDMIHDNSKWKNEIYSNSFDYTTRSTQKAIMRYYIADVGIRIFLIVEGKTEEKIFEEIFKNYGLNIDEKGIQIVNCGGVGKMNVEKLKHIISIINKDNLPVFILADNEGNMNKNICQMKIKIKGICKSHIWEKNFEEDNFVDEEITSTVNHYLKIHNEKLLNEEINKYRKNKKPLYKAICDTYYTKYKKNLDYVISKPDISLHLLKPFFEEISKGEKITTATNIEKIVLEIFKMHAHYIPR